MLTTIEMRTCAYFTYFLNVGVSKWTNVKPSQRARGEENDERERPKTEWESLKADRERKKMEYREQQQHQQRQQQSQNVESPCEN